MRKHSVVFSRTIATRVVAAGMLAVSLVGCSALSKEDEKYEQRSLDPPDLLYNQGLVALKDGSYKKASSRFDALDRQYPGTDWSRKGILMNAFTQYKAGNYDEAITSSQRYMSVYPNTDADMPYAAYIYASANYAQIPDITRDQERTRRALVAFQEIVNRWPKSEYASDSRYKIQVTRDQLAGKEMEIGRYYLKNNNYAAATNRFKVVVQEYQQTRHIEEALSRLTEAYMALGLTSEAQTAAAILGHNYPDSQWYKDAHTLVRSNGLEPRKDEGSWLSKTFRNVITQ